MSIFGISRPMEAVPVPGTQFSVGFSLQLFDSPTVFLLGGFVFFLCCCEPESHTPGCVLQSEQATSLH